MWGRPGRLGRGVREAATRGRAGPARFRSRGPVLMSGLEGRSQGGFQPGARGMSPASPGLLRAALGWAVVIGRLGGPGTRVKTGDMWASNTASRGPGSTAVSTSAVGGTSGTCRGSRRIGGDQRSLRGPYPGRRGGRADGTGAGGRRCAWRGRPPGSTGRGHMCGHRLAWGRRGVLTWPWPTTRRDGVSAVVHRA